MLLLIYKILNPKSKKKYYYSACRAVFTNSLQEHCSDFQKNHFHFLKRIFTLFQLNISSAMSCLYCYCYCNFLEITQQGFNIVLGLNLISPLRPCSLPNFISVDFNLLEH